jgi:TfoX/Sxy family transcriptional regulator of competence genes
MAYDERTAERVRAVLSDRRDVVEKKLMGGLCFMVNGSMCCSVSASGGLLVRADAEMREQMLAEPHVQPADMRGRTMSGFVRVAPEGYRTGATLRTWLERGIAAARQAKACAKPRKKR